ncbi:unnamed protein product [Spirodela intermedia]|uniref:Uncharacterized protein n=1 Tax=Spirodela intermedia TaxID=51605 RepID=A0A7I8LI37_SPIIN|nr:unnamed protein product [Spirodela intermedia]
MLSEKILEMVKKLLFAIEGTEATNISCESAEFYAHS